MGETSEDITTVITENLETITTEAGIAEKTGIERSLSMSTRRLAKSLTIARNSTRGSWSKAIVRCW